MYLVPFYTSCLCSFPSFCDSRHVFNLRPLSLTFPCFQSLWSLLFCCLLVYFRRVEPSAALFSTIRNVMTICMPTFISSFIVWIIHNNHTLSCAPCNAQASQPNNQHFRTFFYTIDIFPKFFTFQHLAFSVHNTECVWLNSAHEAPRCFKVSTRNPAERSQSRPLPSQQWAALLQMGLSAVLSERISENRNQVIWISTKNSLTLAWNQTRHRKTTLGKLPKTGWVQFSFLQWSFNLKGVCQYKARSYLNLGRKYPG